MAQSYNWQNATDNLLPFQDFLWQLQSDKPQEIYFRNDHPQDVILIAVTAILLLLHAISIFFAHPGITRCFAIIIFWPPALNLPIRLVKLFVLSQPYPDTKWLFFVYTLEYTLHYIFFAMYLGSFVTYLLMKLRYTASGEKPGQSSGHFHAPVWVFCILLSILHFNGNYRLYFFPFYLFMFYVTLTTICCLLLIISILIVQCTNASKHRRSLLWLLPFFVLSCPSAVYLCAMTVMDMLYFRFKFHGDDYPTAYTQMAFYRPLAFMLNPVFVIAALLITLPESRMCLPKLCGQNDEAFREVGLSSKAKIVNASVKSSTPPPSNPGKSSPPPPKSSENALNSLHSPRLPSIHTAKVSPLTSSLVATPMAPPRSDAENDAPRQPHLRQFNMNLDETETIIANAPAMPTTMSPQSSPARISPPTVIVNSGVNSTPNTARVTDEGENREGKPTPARFHIRLEPIGRPATRQRRDVEPVKAGNLDSLNPVLYPGATPSDTNKTVIRGELHRLDPMIYPGAAKAIPILETGSPRSERGISPALPSPPATTVASPVSPTMGSTASVPHFK